MNWLAYSKRTMDGVKTALCNITDCKSDRACVALAVILGVFALEPVSNAYQMGVCKRCVLSLHPCSWSARRFPTALAQAPVMGVRLCCWLDSLVLGQPYLPPVRRIRERGAVNSLKGSICLFCLLGCLGYIWCFRKGHRGWHGNSWSSFTRTDTDLHESALRRQGSCAPPIWRTISRELSPNRVHRNHVASARLISLRKAKRWWDPPMGDKLYNTC